MPSESKQNPHRVWYSVLLAHDHGELSEGQACKLLDLSRIELREEMQLCFGVAGRLVASGKTYNEWRRDHFLPGHRCHCD